MTAAGVIGWPVAHSKSPLIHRFWLAKLGMDGDYGRFAVAPERLGAAAVAGVDRSAGTIVVVGAGGAGRAAVAALAGPVAGWAGSVAAPVADDPGRRRAALLWLNRDVSRAGRALADLEVAGTAAPLDTALPGDTVLLVNATSLGMVGMPPLAIDLGPMPPGATVLDLVYAPIVTPLLIAARNQGLGVIDGLAMLIGQAAAAFPLFYGADAPREDDAELRARLTA